MSGEIEFLDPEPEQRPEPPHAAGTGRGGQVVAAIGWAGAAALAALAPFQRLYGGVGLPRRYADYLPGSLTTGVDGWGSNGGGIRFGIALVACAAIFALLAVAAVARAVRSGAVAGLRRPLAGAAVGAPCLLAGVIVMLGIYLASSPPLAGPAGWTMYAPLDTPTSTYGSSLAVTFTGGGAGHSWCLWLAVAAFACAATAAAVQLLAERDRAHLAG